MSQRLYRDVLMDEINDYHHYVSSFVDESVIHNEALVERIDAIFTMVKDIHED